MMFLKAAKVLRPFLKSYKYNDSEFSLPSWYSSNSKPTVPGNLPFFLYQSWIPEHTDKVIDAIRAPEKYSLVDLGMVGRQAEKKQRINALRFAEKNSELYERMALHKLAPFRNRASGLIVTLDWIPAMRHLVLAARQLGIPTILIPHEAVFAKQEMYYVHKPTGTNVPACDLVLAWGALQEEIFVERGFPRERITKTGAPKFDYLGNVGKKEDKSLLTLFKFKQDKFTVTFAAQPLDSQYDTEMARISQAAAIKDLLFSAKKLDFQVIIRMPPSRDDILTPDIRNIVDSDERFAFDFAGLYLLTPEETVAASSALMSVNSTMLLEAALAGKVTLSAKYIDFEQVWKNVRIPVVHTRDEMLAALKLAMMSPEKMTDEYDLDWAARAFSVGKFDGQASARISQILSQIACSAEAIFAAREAAVPRFPKSPQLPAEWRSDGW